MISEVFSSLQSFKRLDLGPGLNILLSVKVPEATEQQTRNRTGKSSFVELIHFVLGGNCDPESTFRAKELLHASFGIELELFGETVRISRSASEPSKVVVDRGSTVGWPIQPKNEKNSARLVISNNNWRRVLGRGLFAIDEPSNSEDIELDGGRPTFRSLFSYFVRRESSGGLREATRNNTMQQIGDVQIALSYLIGFDWTIAQQWESIRRKEKQIKELKRIVGQGVLTDVLDSAASLRSRLVVADQKLSRILTTLSSFRIHDQYQSFEKEASSITRQLANIADENELDRIYIEEIESAMDAESPPAPNDLHRLYEEAGLVLPDHVRKRYEDVLAFHESVIRNRRSYLESERAAASERVAVRMVKRQDLDRRRSEIMGMLKSHGALEQFIALQAEQGRVQGETENLRRRYEAATQLESTSSSLESNRADLVGRLRQEFQERSAVLDDAIRSFSNIVEELYGEPAQLEFHPTHNGPEVRVRIPGDRSRGIENMEIFCFDMMLQHMCARQGFGPGFLVHDSHLFDGVDPRQTARALAVGAHLSIENNFQYIVTLNSDVFAELPDRAGFEEHLIAQRLTDATEVGGLFGLRFEPPVNDRSGDRISRRKRQDRESPLE